MNFGKEDFKKMFLKNYFKQILKEKREFQSNSLDDICKLLADLHVKEFGSGKSPYEIISEYKTVENWLIKKIDDLEYDPQRS